MSTSTLHYCRLVPEVVPPSPPFREPFRAVVLVREPVSNDWRNAVSDWLVAAGCRYMLAWGDECSAWDDEVDWASLAADDFAETPPERFVMTTWHANETIDEVFEFAREWANHPTLTLEETWVIDIGGDDPHAEAALRARWNAAAEA